MQQSTVRGAEEVATLEAEFSELVDGRHSIALNSGVSALQLSLLALGIGGDDEVIVPSFAPESTAAAVQLAGATPVFADIDRQAFCLDPDSVAAVLTPRTAAVVPVHLFGHPAALPELSALAMRHGVALVEDASQASTAALAGRKVGTYGAASIFSVEDASVITTADLQLALTARLLRDQRRNELGVANEAVASGLDALSGLTGATARRRANARFLDSALTGVLVPYVQPGAHHVYHRYTVRIPGNGRPDRDAFARALAARGVRSAVSIPTPVHRLPAHRTRVYLPQTELAAGETLSLPVHSRLTERELTQIASACNTLGGLL